MSTSYQLEVYYAPVCGLCTRCIEFFRSRGLDFTAYAIGYDKENDAWVPSQNVDDMIQRAGETDFLPQIFVNGDHIGGWRKLEPMIESGEFDRLLNDH